MDLYTDIQLENRIDKLNKRLNKEMEILKNPGLSDLKLKASIIRVNMTISEIYDAITIYTSEIPKKIVFVKLKESLENLSLIFGFRPNDNNHTFNVFAKTILEKINNIINTQTERIMPPKPTRSYSRRTPRTQSSAGGKSKKNKNKTNKKR